MTLPAAPGQSLARNHLPRHWVAEKLEAWDANKLETICMWLFEIRRHPAVWKMHDRCNKSHCNKSHCKFVTSKRFSAVLLVGSMRWSRPTLLRGGWYSRTFSCYKWRTSCFCSKCVLIRDPLSYKHSLCMTLWLWIYTTRTRLQGLDWIFVSKI